MQIKLVVISHFVVRLVKGRERLREGLLHESLKFIVNECASVYVWGYFNMGEHRKNLFSGLFVQFTHHYLFSLLSFAHPSQI